MTKKTKAPVLKKDGTPAKKRGKKPKPILLTKEQVKELLERSMGSIATAARIADLPYDTLYGYIDKYKLKTYPDSVKRRIAMAALERAKYLALTPSDVLKSRGERSSERLLLDILQKWGKYIEYEDPKAIEVQPETSNPWHKILIEVDPQRGKEGS